MAAILSRGRWVTVNDVILDMGSVAIPVEWHVGGGSIDVHKHVGM